jgi:outer membrane protein assembly factor BamA
VWLLLLLAGCSTTKYVPEGHFLLDDVKIRSTDEQVKVGDLSSYLRQHPNSKWFSLFKVPLYVYDWSGRDTTRWINRVLRRIGDAPVVYDAELARQGENEMLKALQNKGYINGRIAREEIRKEKKIKLRYHIIPGTPLQVEEIFRIVPDARIDSILQAEDSSATLLRPGMLLDINELDRERNRIVSLLQNRGYYDFNKDYITYAVDTVGRGNSARLALYLNPLARVSDSVMQPHIPYYIDSVRIYPDFDLFSGVASQEPPEGYDTLHYGKLSIILRSGERPYLRPKVLLRNLHVYPDSLYSEQAVSDTYSRYARLGILKYTNMRFEQKSDTNLLNCYLFLSKGRSHSLSFSIEGTNSAGDLGAAASITTEHRNLFRGSETFSLKLRGAYEAISGLTNAITNQYTEYGIEASLSFPRFLFPFLSSEFRRRSWATTELSVGYSNQKRPEFARNIFEGRWSYRWNNRKSQLQHRIDLIDVSYIKMPWISDEYRDNYLGNSILRYNYNDQMIMRFGYGLVFSNRSISGLGLGSSNANTNGYTIRFNVESAGNLLYGLSKAFSFPRNDEGRYSTFGLPYEQYLKGDIDFSLKLPVDSRNTLALHAAVGVAYPYGNSDMLPFSKRYFAGGANGVRGWSVRGLGPGRYSGGQSIDFMNRSGDIKLDLSAEWRTKLFWKLNGAFFIDAGNIWTIRDYESQPGGTFHFNSFYRELAMSYGLGLRFDFDYFILRFDGAMKAIDPAYGAERYPIIHPNFSDDFTFHFAIGYPF